MRRLMPRALENARSIAPETERPTCGERDGTCPRAIPPDRVESRRAEPCGWPRPRKHEVCDVQLCSYGVAGPARDGGDFRQLHRVPRRPIGCAPVGRNPARVDSKGHAAPAGAGSQPVPRVDGDVRRLGCVRRERPRIPLQREDRLRESRGGAERGSVVRGLSGDARPLRRQPERRAHPLVPRRADDRARLLDRRGHDRGRHARGRRQPGRGAAPLLDGQRWLARGEQLRAAAGHARPRESAACRRASRHLDQRPEPLAAARAQLHLRRRGQRGAGRRAVAARAALGGRVHLRTHGL